MERLGRGYNRPCSWHPAASRWTAASQIVAALKIHGGAYHSLGDLHPQPGQQAVFAQLVVFDGVEQHMAAYGTKAGLDAALLGELRRMLFYITT